MTPAFVIRPYTEDDYAAVATVYRSAVEAQAPAGYSQAQIRLWASYPKGGDEFRSRLALGATLAYAATAESPCASGADVPCPSAIAPPPQGVAR